MKKTTIVSGMQPSGELHIGNYLGALKNWVTIQNDEKYQCIFFIADYHSLSENYDPKQKSQQIFNLACDYLAAGIDPEKSTIFVQSNVPACTELSWIFNTLTPVTELERMTQYKDKSQGQQKNINTGLLTYPILQAADILLYHGALVPVGKDQIQHVEMTRDCARWFNHKYSVDFFPETKPLLTPIPKVMSLITPEKKMSKSAGEKHWIGINESPEIIEQKIAKAVTTPEGVENLKTLYNAFKETMSGEFNVEKMAQTKKMIAQGIADHFADFRTRRQELVAQPERVAQILAHGAEQASVVAEKTMREVKRIIGIN